MLERLDPTARVSLAQAGSAFWHLVFPISIFPFGLLARMQTTGGAAPRIFKLVDFLGSAERLAWAKANGCQWDAHTCAYAALRGHLEALKWMREHGCPWDTWTTIARRSGRAPGGVAVDAGARLPVG